MKTKSITMASWLACVFATTAMPISAEEVNYAISGSSFSLGEVDGTPLGNASHITAIPLKKNGKKSNKGVNTAVGNSKTTPVGPLPACYSNDQGQGFLFSFDYDTAVVTQPNGDIFFLELDPQPDPNDLTKVSKACAFPTHLESTIYFRITGGTGEMEGACGWLEANTKGRILLPETGLFAFEGTQVGEIFFGADCL